MTFQPQDDLFSLNHSRAVEDSKPSPPFDVALLGLNKVQGLGRKSLHALVKVFGEDLGLAFASPRVEIQQVLQNAKAPGAEALSESIITGAPKLIRLGEAEVCSLAAKNIHVIGPADMPHRFREIPDGPPWLFVQGNPQVLGGGPFVAIVGTRKPTNQGLAATRIVARQLGAYSIVVVSGLAEGIDEAAHASSLPEGVINIAFLGHGINFSIPASTKDLRARIVRDGGAVVTEYLPDEHFQRSYFVQRNRLQAALADLVIPIEANPTGGTAHTVRFARKYKRKLLGIWWPEANGILKELQREGYPSVDIFSARSQKTLDNTFRALAESAGHDTYALSIAERQFMNEVKRRNVRPEDTERFRDFIRQLGDDPDKV